MATLGIRLGVGDEDIRAQPPASLMAVIWRAAMAPVDILMHLHVYSGNHYVQLRKIVIASGGGEIVKGHGFLFAPT
jgi:hypothetical protein